MEIRDYKFSFKNLKEEKLDAKVSKGGKIRPVVVLKNDVIGDLLFV